MDSNDIEKLQTKLIKSEVDHRIAKKRFVECQKKTKETAGSLKNLHKKIKEAKSTTKKLAKEIEKLSKELENEHGK